ncbi:MAG: hypothetical protein JWL87_521 [Candidatus Adlerbacteria bacterium]|nr:hypothetical protein [Candidatus Adlerbacteria bacterium]
MTKVRLFAPLAALAVGALSMVGTYAFADTKAPAVTVPEQKSAVQTVDDQNKGVDTDVETADDATEVGDTDIETSDEAGEAQEIPGTEQAD